MSEATNLISRGTKTHFCQSVCHSQHPNCPLEAILHDDWHSVKEMALKVMYLYVDEHPMFLVSGPQLVLEPGLQKISNKYHLYSHIIYPYGINMYNESAK